MTFGGVLYYARWRILTFIGANRSTSHSFRIFWRILYIMFWISFRIPAIKIGIYVSDIYRLRNIINDALPTKNHKFVWYFEHINKQVKFLIPHIQFKKSTAFKKTSIFRIIIIYIRITVTILTCLSIQLSSKEFRNKPFNIINSGILIYFHWTSLGILHFFIVLVSFYNGQTKYRFRLSGNRLSNNRAVQKSTRKTEKKSEQ